jgi:DNA invertase Pin-like site-specific DNA recombinase
MSKATAAAIYARFSTDLQNERSTEDQIDLCRTYAEREGLSVVGTYHDKARSGASMLGRDGLFSLLQDAQGKKFDVIVVEALDRLSRDMEDLAGIHKRLSFLGIELRAVHEGTANTLMVGLRGLVGQLMREDNVHKVRRGMTGLIKQGLSAGGRSYGYTPDPINKGKLIIVEEEAEIVRRIFREFSEGKSPRSIAYSLNEQRIRPPRGDKWNASTINGNGERGYGILRNPLYAGELVWNRVQMVKDPDTGRRISRPNPPEKWQRRPLPELRIVDQELWDAVQAQKQDRTRIRPHLQNRPKRLLSGLLKCGCCGAGMSAKGTDKSGRVRIRCSAAAESGICPDPASFYLDTIERLVVDTLVAELKTPKRLTLFIETYMAERKRLAQASMGQRASLERKLATVQRNMDRIIDGIQSGHLALEDVGDRMHVLRAEKTQLKEELAGADEVPNVVTLHPAAMHQYEQKLQNLHEALNEGIAEGNTEAASAFRELVHRVTVYRDAESQKGLRVVIDGALNALMSLQMSSDQTPLRISGGPVGSGGGT